jgi:hypothetical protein
VRRLCKKRSELIAQSAAVVWHKNLLAEVARSQGALAQNNPQQARRDFAFSSVQPQPFQGSCALCFPADY